MSTPVTLGWWEHGEAFFAGALNRLVPADLDEPSLLPGWSRHTVVAHVARNADALTNLLTWARTGVETPMYACAEARDAAIAETAKLPAPELVADCRAAAERLTAAVGSLPSSAWASQVRTAQGRTVPASEVPWMRCREVWVHTVDLDAGADFHDIPDDILTALINDVTRAWQRRNQAPAVHFSASGRTWGTGQAAVSGDLPAMAGYVTGRRSTAGLITNGALPSLPRWL